jgi:hypothetical protein
VIAVKALFLNEEEDIKQEPAMVAALIDEDTGLAKIVQGGY